MQTVKIIIAVSLPLLPGRDFHLHRQQLYQKFRNSSWLGINHRLQLTGIHFQWKEMTARRETPSSTSSAASPQASGTVKNNRSPPRLARVPAPFLGAEEKATAGTAEAGKTLLNWCSTVYENENK